MVSVLHRERSGTACADTYKFGAPQTLRPEGSNQEDYPVRPLHVLPPYITRDETAALLQPREHHLYP